tara:strand:- start:214 stop:705 length:492 start_codon:yes stop_codon:yes gene_type:complete
MSITINIQDVMNKKNFDWAMRVWQNTDIKNTCGDDNENKRKWIQVFLRGLLIMDAYDTYEEGLSAADVPIKGWRLKIHGESKREAEKKFKEFKKMSFDKKMAVQVMGWVEWQDENDLFIINNELSMEYMLNWEKEQWRKQMLRAVAGTQFEVRRVCEPMPYRC